MRRKRSFFSTRQNTQGSRSGGGVLRGSPGEATPAIPTTNLPRSYLLTLASIRNLSITCEQPVNSIFYRLPSVRKAIMMCRLSRHVCWMGGWGGTSLKPDAFYSNLTKASVACIRKEYKSAVSKVGKKRTPLTARCRKANGDRIFVNGRHSSLKESACYPTKFSQALAKLVRSSLSRRAAKAACAV